jgi:hypothetical protein
MSGSHVENEHVLNLLGQIGKQHLIEIVDLVVQVAASI